MYFIIGCLFLLSDYPWATVVCPYYLTLEKARILVYEDIVRLTKKNNLDEKSFYHEGITEVIGM